MFDFKQTTLSADYLCNNDELQKIFEDLFNDPEDPIDFDRFCNEVIDDELASEQQSRDTTPSPVAAVEATFETQPTSGYYEEPLPENFLCDDDAEDSTEVYGTVNYPSVSPSQQVPSPSQMYAGNLSPISIKEETFYAEKLGGTMIFEQHLAPAWDNSCTILDDCTFSDPFLLPYEDVLISSDNDWIEHTIEA